MIKDSVYSKEKKENINMDTSTTHNQNQISRQVLFSDLQCKPLASDSLSFATTISPTNGRKTISLNSIYHNSNNKIVKLQRLKRTRK